MSRHNHNARGVEIQSVNRTDARVTSREPQQKTVMIEWVAAGHAEQQGGFVNDKQILISVE